MRFHPVLLMLVWLPVSHAQVVHRKPSTKAEGVGQDLPWERDLTGALELASRSKRPILWYPPTVPGSPMDRKPVLDLYMRAGIFADPGLRALFRHYVLLRHVPSRDEAKKYGLRPFEFVEPGFLILDGKGRVLDRCSGMTSFPRPWLARRFAVPLAPDLVRRIRDKEQDPTAKAMLERFTEGKFELGEHETGKSAWTAFLVASALFEQGRKADARKAWLALAKDHPEDPLAARALAEAEGFGPIVRGFWTWTRCRKGAALDLPGTTLPARPDELAPLKDMAIHALLRLQEEDGGFEDSDYDFGGQDSLPNVHVAVTALAAMALHRHRASLPEGGKEALAKAVEYVLDPAHRNPADKDEWVWARLYALHMCRLLLTSESAKPTPGPLAKRLAKEAGLCTKDLLARQTRSGAFRHEYSNPFVTASVLLALSDGSRLGVAIEDSALERALSALEKARTRLGAFSYSQPRGKARASLVAAAGRMPLCEAALYAFGRSTSERLESALQVSFEHHDQLESTRKYDDHANRHSYGGFFYWYDQLGRSMAMGLLGEKAAGFRQQQLGQILAIPEIDGSFVDSHELGKSYGTAMALLCLEPR